MKNKNPKIDNSNLERRDVIVGIPFTFPLSGFKSVTAELTGVV